MDTKADKDVIARGAWGTIEFAVRHNGARPAEKFLEELDKKQLSRKRTKLFTLFQWQANGRNLGEQKFKHLKDDIFEFKSGQARVLCFQKGNCWLITNGYIKKQDNCPPREIAKAKRIMQEHLECEGKKK